MEASLDVVGVRAFLRALANAEKSYLQSRIVAKLQKGRVTTRDELLEAVYGGAKEPECSVNSIHTAIYVLRKRGYRVEARGGLYLHTREP